LKPKAENSFFSSLIYPIEAIISEVINEDLLHNYLYFSDKDVLKTLDAIVK
jgi:hypothetical protein